MKPITIEDALERTPFKPFQLILDSGKTVRVQHLDCLPFNGQKTVCVVAEGEHIRVLDVDHLTVLRTVPNLRNVLNLFGLGRKLVLPVFQNPNLTQIDRLKPKL